jgi:hypothetical protein
MEIKSVLVIILIIVLLYIIVSYMTSGPPTLSFMNSGTTLQQITSAVLAKSGELNSSNFSYSIWFYISDWNYRYGEEKVLFGRMDSTPAASSSAAATLSGKHPCPLVTLGSIQNNVNISLNVFPPATAAELTTDDTTESDNSITHHCNVSNVPIQKWVNLLISTYGRTLDVYLDGKLVKTCVMPGVAKINTTSDVFITPNGGFSGWTTSFQYFATSIDPQTAWNIYRKGYGSGSGLLKYKVKVALTENGNEKGSFSM